MLPVMVCPSQGLGESHLFTCAWHFDVCYLEPMALLKTYCKIGTLKYQLEYLKRNCDYFTESEDEISDRIDQGLVKLVNISSRVFSWIKFKNTVDPFVHCFVTGSGSISSGSAKSISTHRSESRLEESFSSSSFPGSPKAGRKSPVSINGTAYVKSPRLDPKSSKSSENLDKGWKEDEVRMEDNQIRHNQPYDENDYNELILDQGVVERSYRRKSSSNRRSSSSSREEFKVARRASILKNAEELPRLGGGGTKSQASTASSSATRDSGISLNDAQRAEEACQKQGRAGKKSYQRMISVNEMPVNGHAVNLTNRRPSTNRSIIDDPTVSRNGSKYSQREQQKRPLELKANKNGVVVIRQQKSTNHESPVRKAKSFHEGDLTPPRSPPPSRYPAQSTPQLAGHQGNLLLRPAEYNSPFMLAPRSRQGSSTNSTPYSQISVPSSYDYEDDFTSEDDSDGSIIFDKSINKYVHPSAKTQSTLTLGSFHRSAHSQRTVVSTTSTGSSRIPIKRNSSLRRKKEVMDNYTSPVKKPIQSTPPEEDQLETKPKPRRTASKSRSPGRLSRKSDEKPVQNRASTLPRNRGRTTRKPIQHPTTKPMSRRSVSERWLPQSQDGLAQSSLNTETSDYGIASVPIISPHKVKHSPLLRRKSPVVQDSMATISKVSTPETKPGSRPVSKGPEDLEPAKIEPETQEKESAVPIRPDFQRSVSYKPPDFSSRHSTAMSSSSVVSTGQLHPTANGYLQYLPLKTKVTLKSPLEGHNLNPFHKPEDFLERTVANLTSTNWESNVTGMAAVVRFARHHQEFLLTEYKPLLPLVLHHVKNLRSQVNHRYITGSKLKLT